MEYGQCISGKTPYLYFFLNRSNITLIYNVLSKKLQQFYIVLPCI